jgi:uncharacterized protein YbjT (DUF2867 family)
MITVAGGTGRLGSRVVTRLRSQGYDVHALGSRDGDLRRITPDALRGASLVVSSVTGFPDQSPVDVDRDGNAALFEAAAAIGAEVVYVSVAQAAPESPMELFRIKYATEELLRRSSTKWTIIRPDGFVETWVEILEQTAGRSRRPLVFGRGDNPFAWVSVETVADEVVRAVLDPGLRGSTLTVSGPESFSVDALARRVMADHGWPGEPRHVPRAALHVMGVLPGKPGRMARASLAMDEV